MDADDRDLFDRSLGAAVTASDGPASLDAALTELGWHDALDTDPVAAVSLLFAHLGAAHATCSALGHVVAAGLGLGVGVGVDDTVADVALPALGATEPPAHLVGSRLHIDRPAIGRAPRRPSTLITARTSDGVRSLVLPTASLTTRPVGGIDPALGLVELRADGIEVDLASSELVDWSAAVVVAQLALGHELVGASRQMLDLARTHALERIQFGGPISGFQAVRHRLAETFIAIESANAVLAGAWEDRSPATAAMAKAMAGRAARTAARHCQQVLAGIGFTTEHPLHLHVRRVLVLDELFGSARTLTASLGRDVIDHRELPPLLPL